MQAPGFSAWSYNSARGAHYLHNFLNEMPDLNLENDKARTEVKVLQIGKRGTDVIV